MRAVTIYLTLCFCCLTIVAHGQVYDVHGNTQLAYLTRQGWAVQHQSLTYDSLQLFMSARAPQQSTYRLYVVTKQRAMWSAPAPLFDTPSNDSVQYLWPTIAPDGEHLYYVIERTRRQGKQTIVTRQITCATLRDQHWQVGDPIIISSDNDIAPLMLPDGETLLFSRWTQTSHRDGHYALYYTRKIDANNWLIPQPMLSADNRSLYGGCLLSENDSILQVTEQICQRKDTTYRPVAIPLPKAAKAKPYRVLTGRIVDEQTQRAIQGTVDVYDALTAQRLFTAHTHPATGRFRIALPQNREYRIDCSAPNYSHYYITDENHADIALSKQLNLTIGVYDAKERTPLVIDRVSILHPVTEQQLSSAKHAIDSLGHIHLTLPLNNDYRVVCSKRGYYDYAIDLSTGKPIRFAQSEFDITMQPKMTQVCVTLRDAETGDTLQGSITGETYLRQQQVCSLSCMVRGYFFTDTTFVTVADTIQHIVVALHPLKKDMVVQLRNIQFAYNSYLLSETSFDELEKVRLLMVENPTMEIEVSAHTDDRGSDAYNDRLSTLRGESVARYLIKAGIQPQRIHTIGYGKRRPLVPNDSDENRERNRRVEFKVLSNEQ